MFLSCLAPFVFLVLQIRVDVVAILVRFVFLVL